MCQGHKSVLITQRKNPIKNAEKIRFLCFGVIFNICETGSNLKSLSSFSLIVGIYFMKNLISSTQNYKPCSISSSCKIQHWSIVKRNYQRQKYCQKKKEWEFINGILFQKQSINRQTYGKVSVYLCLAFLICSALISILRNIWTKNVSIGPKNNFVF